MTTKVLDYFSALVADDDSIPLTETALSIAQDAYPDLDLQAELAAIDVLVARIKNRVADGTPAIQRLRLLNQFFYRELGFGPNANDYYDPDNSYLHVMLRTRRGIPISLALLWLELAGQIGLDAHGVGFPGHFLVKVHLPYPHEGKVVIDPFNGHSLTKEDLMERLSPLYAESGLARDGEISDELLKHYLRSASPREIMTRMLRNLEEVYGAQSDTERLDAVKKRLKVLLPSLDEAV